MTDQVRHAKRSRGGGQGAQQRRAPDLTFSIFDEWSRKLMQRGTLYRDSNVELRSRVPMVFVKPKITAKVKERVECEDGKTRPRTRPWSSVDDKRYDAAMQIYQRQVKELRDDHGAQWNDRTGNITDKVIDATELESTYRAIEDKVDPLGLLLLLEKVCTRNSVNNVEALRTEWQDLRYRDGDCIFGFFNRFDALVKNIDRASGTGEAIRDWDKVYRLRQALPEPKARQILVTAFAYDRTEKEYPSYDWCKRVSVAHTGCLILELDKFIYGLKQAPAKFQAHLTAALISIGYTRCK
jgi:hypothetical protein